VRKTEDWFPDPDLWANKEWVEDGLLKLGPEEFPAFMYHYWRLVEKMQKDAEAEGLL
jgi:hypothetical protein